MYKFTEGTSCSKSSQDAVSGPSQTGHSATAGGNQKSCLVSVRNSIELLFDLFGDLLSYISFLSYSHSHSQSVLRNRYRRDRDIPVGYEARHRAAVRRLRFTRDQVQRKQ